MQDTRACAASYVQNLVAWLQLGAPDQLLGQPVLHRIWVAVIVRPTALPPVHQALLVALLLHEPAGSWCCHDWGDGLCLACKHVQRVKH